jgi:GTPase
LATTAARSVQDKRPILISALTGEGIPDLLTGIEERLSAGRPSYEVSVAPEDGQGLAWLHENTEILDRHVTEHGRTVARVRMTSGKESRFLVRFPQAQRL